MDQKWIKNMMAIGVLSYREQERLWDIAKRCTKTVGIPTAGAGFVLGSAGFVHGAVAGALGGLFYGTAACTLLNVTMKKQLKKLAEGVDPEPF
ncbi:MAG: hypothetical protein WA952_05995 [Lewinella sp.]